jgi:hypothetical protein
MSSPELDAVLRAQRFTLTALWLALFASIGIYVAVAFIVTGGAEPTDETPQEVVVILGIVALTAAIASELLPRRLLSDDALRTHMRAKGEGTNDANAKLSEREQRIASVSALYMAPWLVGVALAETVAIVGLVLALVTMDTNLMFPFVGVAAVLMLFKRPDIEAFVERAKALSW